MPVTSRPKGLFITGTDTGVGKTLIAAALARVLTVEKIKVGVMKPAETGVDNPQELGPDGALLKWAAGSSLSAEKISPYRLQAPLAPAVAATREQVRIDYTTLLAQARQIISEHEFTLIEGAGGLMVPLAGGLLMADFARDVGLPLLVVCRAGLGTINHTLLTLYAARCMDLPCSGYLINGMPENKTAAEETAAHTLASMTSDELLGVMNLVSGTEKQKVARLADQLLKLPTLQLLAKHLPETFSGSRKSQLGL